MRLKKEPLFFSVCLLVSDGQQLSGSRQSVEEHLIEEYRRCSYYSDRQVDLERIVKKKEFKSCSKSLSRSPYNSSFCQQLNSVLKRTFKNILINPQSFVSEVSIFQNPDTIPSLMYIYIYIYLHQSSHRQFWSVTGFNNQIFRCETFPKSWQVKEHKSGTESSLEVT